MAVMYCVHEREGEGEGGRGRERERERERKRESFFRRKTVVKSGKFPSCLLVMLTR